MKSTLFRCLLALLIASPSLAQALPASGSPAASERVFAGLLEHGGGFVNRKLLPLVANFYTQDIEIVIPESCPAYEVADVGIVTPSGTSFLAESGFEGRSVRYHLAQPAAVSHLEVTLLAPAESCQLPVYVRAVATPHL